MKTTHYFILLTGLLGCYSPNEPDTETLRKSKQENQAEFEKIHGVTKPNWGDYKIHFSVIDSAKQIYQYLGLNVHPDSTLSYLIIATNDLCDLTFQGTASVNFSKKTDLPSKSPALDAGMHYYEEREGIIVHLQIKGDTSEATLEFLRPDHADECDPFVDLVLKRGDF